MMTVKELSDKLHYAVVHKGLDPETKVIIVNEGGFGFEVHDTEIGNNDQGELEFWIEVGEELQE